MKKIVIASLISMLLGCAALKPITPTTYNESLITAQSQYIGVANTLENSIRLERFSPEQERVILKAMEQADYYLDLAELAAQVDEEDDGMGYLGEAMNILVIIEKELK